VKPPNAQALRLLGALAAGVLATQIFCPPALATLGEDVTTVENDRIQMKAQLRTTSVAGYEGPTAYDFRRGLHGS
jgi:hypothetical protein